MYDVKKSLHAVLDTLPSGVRLVAISKFHPPHLSLKHMQLPGQPHEDIDLIFRKKRRHG